MSVTRSTISLNGKALPPEKTQDLTEQEQQCAQQLVTLLPQLRRIVSRDFAGLEFPLTLQQYAVLKALNEHSYLISELAEKFKVSRPTMTRIIDGLEGRRRLASNLENDIAEHEEAQPIERDRERRPKLVERTESQQDRRLVHVHITREGQQVLKNYYCKVEESVAELLRTLPPGEVGLVSDAFAILQKALQAANI